MITAMAILPILLQEAFGSGAAALARGGLLPPQYPTVRQETCVIGDKPALRW